MTDPPDSRRSPGPEPMRRADDGPTSHAEDLALARAAVAGAAEARRTFADRMRCVPRILAALNARMGRPLGADDVADLAQEIVLRIWSKLATFHGRASLETWAYGFCALELRNEVRRVQKRPRTGQARADGDSPDESVPEVDVVVVDLDQESGLVRSEFDGWLAQLPERERAVVRMRHFDGLEAKEIAVVLGIALSSVKTHYYRALEKLRRSVPDPDAPSREGSTG